ncbi:MAG: 50S ribosomal protein L4 [Puniceicoccales bacterium]|jgi:large subunit ribosomal protein L4|nr:50S ribosomal protein L4 [Puniceicoccales bacterium]
MKVNFYGVDGVFREEREYNIPTFEEDRGLQTLKDVILAYQSNLRQGNACTKTRGDVQGSGKKPYRQKGTGMARQGEKRSPIWRGGGVVFGPKPRDFSVSINKKEKKLALRRALFDTVSEGKLSILECLRPFDCPKTSLMVQWLHNWMVKGKILLVDNEFEKNVLLSARNLDRVYTVDTSSLNALDLCRYTNILVTERALLSFLDRIG